MESRDPLLLSLLLPVLPLACDEGATRSSAADSASATSGSSPSAVPSSGAVPGPSAAPSASAVTVSAEPPTHCPPATAFIPDPGVCIHQWEGRLFDADGKLHDPYRVPPHPSKLKGMAVRSSPGVVPQGYLGREQAEIVCGNTKHESYQFRLCTTAEWEAACRGPEGKFPTYQDAMVARCNTGKFPEEEHLVYRFYPEPRWTYRELTDPRINKVPGGLGRTGARRRCTNAFDVFDMVGNLQEWTADLPEKKERVMSTIKGDHYMGQGKNYVGCAATNTAHFYIEPSSSNYAMHKDWKDYSTGVRCCADPR